MAVRAAPALPAALRARMPGLEAALDPDGAASVIERLLLDPSASVASVEVGSIWLEASTCTLRYRVRTSSPHDAGSERIVLASIGGTSSVAAASPEGPPPAPWRTWQADDAGGQFGLSVFPCDPALPTLPRALDPVLLGQRRIVDGLDLGRATVTVVHHPRRGACVLSYAVDGRLVFAKVYGDDRSGRKAAGVLRALAGRSPTVRFPTLQAYDPALRLLITEAVPGRAVELPREASIAGRTLAEIHSHEIAGVALRSVADDLDEIDAGLAEIAWFRPDLAAEVRGTVGACAVAAADDPSRPTLTHGDYTPSQLLVDGERVGVLDLDDACVADPARDLGRFVASYALRARRHGGRDDVTEVGGALLEAYAGTRPGRDRALCRRMTAHRSLSLARSAIRSCRQLKEERLDAALELLRERSPQ